MAYSYAQRGVCRLRLYSAKKAARGRISKNRDHLMSEFRYKNQTASWAAVSFLKILSKQIPVNAVEKMSKIWLRMRGSVENKELERCWDTTGLNKMLMRFRNYSLCFGGDA